MYEIEYPKVSNNRIEVKIIHILTYEIDLKKDESEWPKGLTEAERKMTRQRIGESRVRLLDGGSDAKTYSALVQQAYSYITFKLDLADNKFKFEKIETK